MNRLAHVGPQKACMTTFTVVLFAMTRIAGNLCFHSERNLKVKCGICLVMEHLIAIKGNELDLCLFSTQKKQN